MTLLTVLRAELAFGMTPLLDQATLTILAGERIGFIGRNGSGKSSLLAAIAGHLALDGGEISRRDGLRVVCVEQETELPQAPDLATSLALRGRAEAADSEGEDWHSARRLRDLLQRFGLDGTRDPRTCSGGERKRAALALAFSHAPDLLLLDEPTNHLDLDAIEQLEALLLEEQRGARAAIVITHDRRFLDRVATRIVELDRGVLRSFPGSFADYEARKDLALQAEAQEQRRFERFWAQEEAWIRKGVEARRTRNEGRVRRLEQLRRQREERRERSGMVNLQLSAGERSGRVVAELEGVGKRFGDRIIVQDLSLRLLRGDRLALIGPNGAGKSSLIKLVLGQITPDAGSIRHGTRLSIAYFDQQRMALDPEQSLAETIAPGSDWVEVGTGRKHIIAYLGDFLFAPRRATAPVRTLSGGERNRLLLARLFAQPANLLVLDEPTNDLDMETLDLLEATLSAYAGSLLLVTHDRRLIDNVATQCLVAEGQGRWTEYVGGYSDWLRQRAPPRSAQLSRNPRADAPPALGSGAAAPVIRAQRPAKLGFREQRELSALPAQIQALESEQAGLQAAMTQADYLRTGPQRLHSDSQRLAQIELLLEQKLARWIELDGRQVGGPT